MKLKYIKANPSGNTTVFITSPVPRHLYPSIASIIMKPEYLAAEQVGYIEPSLKITEGVHLEMMAGEFCGNASRCFAAWQVMKKGGTTNNDNIISLNIDVSGTKNILPASVKMTNDAYTYDVNVEMPLPQKILLGKDLELGEYGIVDFNGIVHLVLWNIKPDVKYIELAYRILSDIGISDDAIGLMFLNTQSLSMSMTPLVYIKNLKSLIWENSCGSGSSAVAAILSIKSRKNITQALLQPGGILTVNAVWDDDMNQIRKIYLSGRINFTSEGTLYIPSEDDLPR
ncbi:hypothetical protein [uncultured Cloacibacillus sp.]|uniref:hypothetical protein n=1 Tax=uncultured Cloacibacillus sp. TaxID=889794 RepID=UPI0026DB9169|nr:hypothetical protein [uncultured Cloacibacillus sp.]